MIKRFRFDGASLASAPAGIAPLRVTASVGDGLAFSACWFVDRAALDRYVSWEADQGGAPAGDAVVVAEEVIQRGADWLEARWRAGGPRWKHVALARRAPGRDAEGFSRDWRAHAGTAPVAAGAPAQPLPDAVKGQAYVQNHPIAGGDWPWDAITEVWFDDKAAMQARAEWFAVHPPADDLFAAPRFGAVREQPVD